MPSGRTGFAAKPVRPVGVIGAGPEAQTVKKFQRLLAGDGARNGEAHPALGATACKHLAAIGCRHTGTEAVLVNSLSVRRLECSFHCRLFFILVVVPHFEVQI